MNRKHYFFLGLLICLSFIIKIFNLLPVTLGGDFERDWQLMEKLVDQGQLPQIGPSASVNDSFYLGPGYYYFLEVIYLLSAGNFQVGMLIFSLLGSLSIILFFSVTHRLFGKNVAVISTVLYSLSPYLNSILSFPWNPYILPLMTLLTLWFYIRVVEDKKFEYLPWLSCNLGLMTHSHATAIFLIPIFVWGVLFKLKSKISSVNPLYILSAVLGLLLTLTPYFSQLSQIAPTITSTHREECNFEDWLNTHGNGEECFHYLRNTLFVGRIFSSSIIGKKEFVLATISLLIIASFLIWYRGKQRYLLRAWLLIPWSLFMLYSKNVYLHYFLIFLPLPFWMMGIGLAKILAKKE